MIISKSFILGVFTLSASLSACGAVEERNSNSTSAPLSTKALERMASYRNSIKYWDTDSPELRQAVLQDLSKEEPTEEVNNAGCPRIRHPMVCDNQKVLLENVCYFRMKRRNITGLLPVMVFTKTRIEDARPQCEGGL